MFTHLKLLFIVITVILFSGCGGKYETRIPSTIDVAKQKKTDRLNDAIIQNALTRQVSASDGYMLGPEDLLEIEAHNLEELKKTVRVNSMGEIALPLVGVLNVRGKSTSEVEQLIAKRLEKYVEHTVVNVSVKEYRSQRISVVGAVKSPQVIAVTGQRYLIDMLMMAGGLASEAGNICYINRPPSGKDKEGRGETIIIDLDEFLVNGNFSLNVPVFAGDIINVPRGGVFFVDGEINAPGSYPLSGKTSLVQAISMAHGLKYEASLGDIRIFRDNGKSERDVIIADYTAIMERTSPDIVLAENDIIIIPRSGMRVFLGSFINTVRGVVTLGSYTVFK